MESIVEKIDPSVLPEEARRELIDFYDFLIRRYTNKDIEVNSKNDSKSKERNRKNKLKKILMNAPIWDGNEVKEFEKTVQQGYRNWKIKEF